MVSSAVPKFSGNDPLMSGEWHSWGGWLWFVWCFTSGWREWVPASTQLVLFITIGGGQDVSREEVIMKTTQSLITLHEQYGLEDLHETAHDITTVIEEQLNYNANEKSNWYYDSIPGLSTWQKYVVM